MDGRSFFLYAGPRVRDIEIRSVRDWPTWKRELYHEMFHEYQFKIIQPRNIALRLLNEFQQRGGFYGMGHNLDFYIAIADKAETFGVTPDELAGAL